MNIVHFGKYYYPDTGGIESVTLSLARGAAICGHAVSVVCFDKDKDESVAFVDNVKVIRAPVAKLLASQPLGFRYVLLCLETAKEADIIHMHAPNMLGALCAVFFGQKSRLLVHWHSDVVNKGVLGKFLRPLEFALLRRANCIVTTSQVYAEASATLASFRNKVAVVPIGVPDAIYDGAELQLPPLLDEQISGRKIVLSVGRLVPYKGFDVLIDAAKQLSIESVVVIVGGGPMQQALMHAVEVGGVKDRVLLTGRLSDVALHALFERSTLYCLPSTSRAEAFGVVLLEAMSYGLPIVATNIPGSGVPWVNQHDISGLNVPLGNPVALADACNQILTSEVLRSRLSKGARQRYLAEFTEDVSVKRMMATYDRLVAL